MKKTGKEWMAEISPSPRQRGSDAWFEASCPICGLVLDADVRGGEGAGRAAAKMAVVLHIRRAHPEEIAD